MGERLTNHRKHLLIFLLREIEPVDSLDVGDQPHSQILIMLKVGKKAEPLHLIISVHSAAGIIN
jgi:hypothetical protein